MEAYKSEFIEFMVQSDVLKLRLYKDEQKSEIFCSSFESASIAFLN